MSYHVARLFLFTLVCELLISRSFGYYYMQSKAPRLTPQGGCS